MTRTFNGRAFRLKEHIDRFYRSLRYLRLDPGMSPQEMIDVSEQIVTLNEHLRSRAGDWWIGQRVSRGVDPIDDEMPEHSGPNVIVECTPLPLRARARQFRDGLDVWTPAQRRIAPDMLTKPEGENAQLPEYDRRGAIGESARPRWLGGATRCKRKSRRRNGQQHLYCSRGQAFYTERALCPSGCQPK
jgi:hypothetical protein